MNSGNVDRTIKIAEEVKRLLQELGVGGDELVLEDTSLNNLIESSEDQAESEGGVNDEEGYMHDTLLEVRNTLIPLVNLKNKIKEEALEALKEAINTAYYAC